MTIASEIQRINTNIANAYTSASQKGATLPEVQNSANLAQTISTIQGGSGPNIYPYTLSNGTITRNSGNITFTGVESIVNYGMYFAFYENSAITGVSFPDLTSVSSSGLSETFYKCKGIQSISFPELLTVGSYGMYHTFRNTHLKSISFPKLQTVGEYGMHSILYENVGLKNVSFPELTRISDNGMAYSLYKSFIESISFPKLKQMQYGSLQYAFNLCRTLTGDIEFPSLVSLYNYSLYYAFSQTGITSISFPELKSNSGSYSFAFMCSNCINLASISFPKLSALYERGMSDAFRGCESLTSISFPELTTIGNYGMQSAFNGCANITSISFPKLTTIGNYGMQYAFASTPSLLSGSISFPELTTIGTLGLARIFDGNTGITEVHFKSSLSGHSQCTAANMGCTNATIYFDLP